MAQEQETVILPAPITVKLRREPFCDWFIFNLDDGSSEELEPEEARNWFKSRGANMIVVEKALDYCWNFYSATITLKRPQMPIRSPLEPVV